MSGWLRRVGAPPVVVAVLVAVAVVAAGVVAIIAWPDRDDGGREPVSVDELVAATRDPSTSTSSSSTTSTSTSTVESTTTSTTSARSSTTLVASTSTSTSTTVATTSRGTTPDGDEIQDPPSRPYEVTKAESTTTTTTTEPPEPGVTVESVEGLKCHVYSDSEIGWVWDVVLSDGRRDWQGAVRYETGEWFLPAHERYPGGPTIRVWASRSNGSGSVHCGIEAT